MLCTAHAVTESSSVQTRPPCTTPMGLYADSSGRQVNETRPGSTSETPNSISPAIGAGGSPPSRMAVR